MAENIIKSRVMLKYDTLVNWNSSNLVLKKGEVAIAEVPSATSDSGLTPPAIGIKVGDGTKTFSQLGWIQAVAGDVYAWAKAATPPSADQISGLSDYISGHIDDTNTKYRVTTGIGTDINKYFLQSQELGSSDWTTVSTIDLSNTVSRIAALETWANITGNTASLTTQMENAATRKINELNSTDGAVAHQFINYVTQNNGIISANHTYIGADDITSGTFSVARGGTGVSTLAAGQVLIGNGTNAITTRPIDSEVTTTTALITSGAVKTYVDNALSNISGAMHFIGVASYGVDPNSQDEPVIIGNNTYSVANAKPGDVILANDDEEFVWDGSSWHLLGRDTIYAVAGQITKSDLASALQTEINGKLDSSTAQSTYVAKNGTDRLMTAAEGTKLSGIETGAEVNIIEKIYVGSTATTVDTSDKSVTLGTIAGKNTISESDLDSALATKINSAPSDLHDIAYDGDVGNLTQTTTYLVIDCGNGSDKLYN